MMRLRSLHKSPPIGFSMHDPATGWRYHSWSFKQTAAAWCNECKKRGKSTTQENAELEVERYLCMELMKTPGWQAWVAMTPQRQYNGEYPTITIRRTAALGDVLMASTVALKLKEQGYNVAFQADPSTHCLLRRIKCVDHVLPVGGQCDVDLDGIYEKSPLRTTVKSTELFLQAANHQLAKKSVYAGLPQNLTPRMEFEVRLELHHPRPWTMIIPRSANWPNRTIPDETWSRIAPNLPGTVFWAGMHHGPSNVVDLCLRHMDSVIGHLAVADLVLSPDTGPMHVAAALCTPVIVIEQASSPNCHLSDQNDFTVIKSPHISCQNCQQDRCPINANVPPCQQIDPQIIIDAAMKRLRGGVSVVVAVYRPDANRLNRCLEAVLPQVDEVVIAADTASVIPSGVIQHEKVRIVVSKERDTGYGRKANFGARHTNGEYIWFLNDDCFVGDNCLNRLMDVMKSHPKIGMVGHLLRYLNGTIQHGGTFRASNGIGFGHMDIGQREGRVKHPIEVENVTGASILLRRRAFYESGCFPEDVYLYTEDNHLCMQIRQKGWKIFYTPHAEAIHEEHCSTHLTPNLHLVLQQSNESFGKKWGWYFDLNRNREGLGVFK